MITPQLIHGWYLEATANLDAASFNPKARKPYEELSEEQKSIDEYIANKINEYVAERAGSRA